MPNTEGLPLISDVTLRGVGGRLNRVTMPKNESGGGVRGGGVSPELCDTTCFPSLCQ